MLYSLKSRILLTFSLLLIVPFVTMLVIFSEQSKESVGKVMKASSSQTLDQYAAYLKTLNVQVGDIAFQILGNDLTQSWLQSRHQSQLQLSNESYIMNAKMRDYLASIALNHSNVASITLFDHHNLAVGIDSVYSLMDPQDFERYQAFLSSGRSWMPAHKDPYQPYHIQDQYVNSLIFPLVDFETLSVQGIIKINVLTSYISAPLSNVKLNEWSTIYLVDSTGRSLISGELEHELLAYSAEWQKLQSWNTEHDVIQMNAAQGEKDQFWFFRKLPELDWIVIGEIAEKELFREINTTQRTMLMISGALLLLTIFAAYWISSDIVRPLSKLSSAMRKVEMGDFQAAEKLEISSKGEAGYVIRVFVRMVQHLNQLIREEFTLKLRKRDAEYKALLMQVNPHFLYNTLEAIGGLAAQDKKEQVIDVTESLGQMLRYSLQLDTEIVPLKSELNYVKYYTSIIENRFEDEVEFDIEVDPSSNHVKVIKFILQPLIENAVKYSREHTQKAKISIVTRREGNQLMLEVADNGKGMTSQQVSQTIRDAQHEDIANVLGSQGKQIGLRNVIARCRLYYHDRFEIKIHSEEGRGTRIQLILPISE